MWAGRFRVRVRILCGARFLEISQTKEPSIVVGASLLELLPRQVPQPQLEEPRAVAEEPGEMADSLDPSGPREPVVVPTEVLSPIREAQVAARRPHRPAVAVGA